MRRGEGIRYIEDGDKYYILMDLYNDWHERTCFMSVGNTNVEEWDKLLKYCKENKTEAAHFYLDLIECYDNEHKEGYRNDNFVGFFNDIIYECFKDDEEFPKIEAEENTFVPGDLIQNMYSSYIDWRLNGKSKKHFGDWLMRMFNIKK